MKWNVLATMSRVLSYASVFLSCLSHSASGSDPVMLPPFDRYPDIVVVIHPESYLPIQGLDSLRNRGNGFRTGPYNWGLCNSEFFIVAEDMNEDGWPDEVGPLQGAVYREPGMPERYINRQRNRFLPPEARKVCAGDFDEDGHKDIAVSWLGIEILTSDGTTRFPLHVPSYHFGGAVPYDCILSSDVNGDGHLDILASEYRGCGIHLFTGRGDGTFPDNPIQVISEPDCPESGVVRMRLVDLDGDGIQDLIYGDGGRGLCVAWGNGNGFEPAERLLRTEDSVQGAFDVVDITGEGILDVVAATYQGALYIFRGTGEGRFDPGRVVRQVPEIGTDLDAVDLDLDGFVDLVMTAYAFPSLLIMCGDSTGSFSEEVRIRIPGSRDDWYLYWTPQNIVIRGFDTQFIRGDSNRDEKVDIADAVRILSYLFKGGERPPCLDSSDANDDGQINIADPIAILFHLFGGGPALPAPFPQPGWDPTDDEGPGFDWVADDLGCGLCWNPFDRLNSDFCMEEVWPGGEDAPVIFEITLPR